MINIDFSKIKDIDKKIGPQEIDELNNLFKDSSIQNKILEIEKHQKTRKITQIIAFTVYTIILFFIGKYFQNQALSNINNTVNGDAMAELINYMLMGYFAIWGAIKWYFSNKIELPLKSEILSKMCPILYSKLQYSSGEKFSFSDIGMLVSKKFLKNYDQIEKVEDSIYFDVTKDGKIFYVNGFELETSQTTGTGKNRRKVTTNHDYLLKVEFPFARIPLKDDVLIESSFEGKSQTKILIIVSILAVIAAGLIWNFNIYAILLTSLFFVFSFIIIKFLKRKDQVKLENVEFEKMYDVFSNDQISSRMIVDPVFMDKLTEFTKKTQNKYSFLFQSNIMYVKRKINGNYLDMSTNKKISKNIEGFLDFYIDMKEIMQFIFEMNLMYLSKTDINFKADPNYIHKNTPITMSGNNIFGNNVLNGFRKIFFLKI